MRWLGSLLSLIGAAAWLVAPFVAAPSPVQARALHPPTAFFCPFGWTGKDNCLQAPQPGLTPGVTGTWQHADCFTPAGNGWVNQVAGVSTDYTNARDHNIAGCDFPIGALNTPAQADVATVTWPDSACSYSATGGTLGNPQVACISTVTDADLSNLTFAGNGDHGCVNLLLPASLSGSRAILTIYNSIFQDNTGICGVLGGILGALIFTPGGTTYTLNFVSVTGTGMGLAGRPTGTDSAQSFVSTHNGLSGQFVVMEDFPGRTVLMGPGSGVADSLSLSDSMIAGWSYMYPDAHGEWLDRAPGSGQLGMTALNLTDVAQVNKTSTMVFQTAPVACCLGIYGIGPIDNLNMVGTLVVNSRAGGATKTATLAAACIGGAPPVDGDCDMTTHGANLYIVSVTGGTAGTGEKLTCTSRTDVMLGTNISGGTSAGPGGGYTFGNGSVVGLDTDANIAGLVGTIDDGSGGSGNTLTITTAGNADLQVGSVISGTGLTSVAITAFGTGTGGVGTYTLAGSAQLVSSESLAATFPNRPLAGTWSMAPQTCNSMALTSDTSLTDGAELFGTNAEPIGASLITDNIIDMSAVTSGGIWYSANSTCTNPTTFANNSDPSSKSGAKPNNWTGGTTCTP